MMASDEYLRLKIATLSRKLDAKSGECGRLLADKVRVDWLETKDWISLEFDTRDGVRRSYLLDDGEVVAEGATHREAIDAAMRVTHEKGRA